MRVLGGAGKAGAEIKEKFADRRCQHRGCRWEPRRRELLGDGQLKPASQRGSVTGRRAQRRDGKGHRANLSTETLGVAPLISLLFSTSPSFYCEHTAVKMRRRKRYRSQKGGGGGPKPRRGTQVCGEPQESPCGPCLSRPEPSSQREPTGAEKRKFTSSVWRRDADIQRR